MSCSRFGHPSRFATAPRQRGRRAITGSPSCRLPPHPEKVTSRRPETGPLRDEARACHQPRALKTRRYKAKSNKNGPYLRVLRARFPQQRKMRPGRRLSGTSRPHQAPPHAISRHDMPSGNDGRHRFLSGGHPDMPESWDGGSPLTRRGGAAAPRRHRRPAAGPRPRRTPSSRHPSCSGRSARWHPPCRSGSA